MEIEATIDRLVAEINKTSFQPSYTNCMPQAGDASQIQNGYPGSHASGKAVSEAP
ncbi:uncharacterized protein SOCE836_020380 [Sorangium cellulosum]|uniref:Uncharacterized protein n=1 Tax=Sorangium cellulosum TaxID=56 RepID=A0A4P2QKG7_SORCE|nr:uncharacterized protein SOCE836_020380 [Sorangium cellulosum]WCQ89332.1 hypothetical protein NQZ70_02019 [Sorangium sp. Soce836]